MDDQFNTNGYYPDDNNDGGRAPADGGQSGQQNGQGWSGGSGYNGGYQSGGYDRDTGSYHYSYVPQSQYGAPTPPPSYSTPPQPPQQKKKGGVGRVIAAVVACALIGTGAGFGGAAIYGAVSGGHDAAPGAPVTIYQNDTDPRPVDVKKADGLTPMSLAEINAAYADSCVCITVKGVTTSGRYQYEFSGAGSGFILSEDGYIVTNNHVVENAQEIQVTLNNGQSYPAKLIGAEELNDVAVLKIDGISGLKPVVIGDSDDLVVGETVCTIGNALGTLSFSLTSGTVSATGRSITMTDGTVMNYIQTNCTINSGNSGGPLFDSYGRVCGITSAKYSNNGDTSEASIEGIGFAIPINDVIGIITDYIEHGYVTGRPYMGILQPTTVDEQWMETFGWPAGVYVNDVQEGSCAEKAGIRRGDIIMKIDDTEITDANQMVSVKNSYKAGDTVTVTLYRAGETLTVQLTFDEQTEQQTTQTQPQTPSGNQGGGNGFGNGGGYGYGDEDDFYGFDPWEWFFGR